MAPILTRVGNSFGFGAPSGGGAAPFEASGGTKITDGDYTYHVFVTDTPAPAKSLVISSGTRENCEILVVASGGSSGYDNGGGGGAGGVAHVPSITLTVGTHPVIVGEMKPGAPTRGAHAPHTGNDSKYTHPFGVITAKGGGGSAFNPPNGYAVPNAKTTTDGGSGAGGRRTNPGSDPSYTGPPSSGIQPTQNPGYPVTVNNYGHDGGNAESGGANWWFAGGGGGAGGAGQPYNSGRAGGAGQPFPTFPGPVTAPGIPSPERTNYTTARGPTHLIAGGGGGSSESPSTNGAGGTGGGGPGGPNTQSDLHGTYGTGGGGGSGGGAGGNGASGIVIVRYLT